MLTVACVRWGNKYGREYVNNLYDMVNRNLSYPFRFVCYTDDPYYDEGIETRSLPDNLEGWWGKLYLFSQDLGRVMYLDLDTVITGRLEEIADYKGKFAILRDFYRSDGYGSGVMLWEGSHSHIWESYKKAGFPDIEGGDQAWIERKIINADLLQDVFPNKFCSYKEQATKWPPSECKVVCFHGEPNPHECDGWVEDVWKIGGMGEPALISKCNVEIDILIDNIKHSSALGLPIAERGEKKKPLILIAGGPSLKDALSQIRYRQLRKNDLWSMNGTHDWLIERGIVPDYFIMLDAREENVSFVEKPHRDVHYYIASQCHPKVFEALEGYNVTIWHAYQEELYNTLLETVAPGEDVWMLGGGGPVALKLLYLGAGLGYKTFHLYGMDSCYRDGAHHAYKQTLNDNEKRLIVHLNGKEFICALWMVRQAQDYQSQLRNLIEDGCIVHVHGEGLIPYIHNQLTKGVAQHV